VIPRIIHYCWVGESPLGDINRKCLDSWARFCPGWTLMEWNDRNLPRAAYVEKARSHRNFSNVSNFVRLFAVWHHGGIYLDADVELIRSPEMLLNERCFFGFQTADLGPHCVNNAVFGAVPHHPFVKEMLERLVARFDGLEPSDLSGPGLTTDLLREDRGLPLGSETDASQVALGDITIFPKRFFAPFEWNETFHPQSVAPDTLAVHWWTLSWKHEKDRRTSGLRHAAKSALRKVQRGGKDLIQATHANLVESPRVKSGVRKVREASIPQVREDGVTLVSLVRNGEASVGPFLEHHLRLGVDHVVLMDNQSTDRTVAIARGYDRVSIYSLDRALTGHDSQIIARRYLVERLCRTKWCLWLDVDELFDYPYSAGVDLPSLTAYLQKHSYTAVVAQMLDMFADAPLNRLPDPGADVRLIRERYPYYDLSAIDQSDYAAFGGYRRHHNRVSNPRIKFHTGGIRRKIFDTRQWLTKHPLIFLDGRLRPVTQQHWVTHASCADFSCVLYHYKFLPDFYERNRRAADSGFGSTFDYDRLASTYNENPGLVLKRPTARKLETVMDLVDSGFLVVSEQYQAWAMDQRALARTPRPARPGTSPA
jgi:hypothetical protein